MGNQNTLLARFMRENPDKHIEIPQKGFWYTCPEMTFRATQNLLSAERDFFSPIPPMIAWKCEQVEFDDLYGISCIFTTRIGLKQLSFLADDYDFTYFCFTGHFKIYAGPDGSVILEDSQ